MMETAPNLGLCPHRPYPIATAERPEKTQATVTEEIRRKYLDYKHKKK
jgi:hypothetical protein